MKRFFERVQCGNMLQNVVGGIAFICILFLFFTGCLLLGDSFRQHVFLYLAAWITLMILAILAVLYTYLDVTYFKAEDLRSQRNTLMVLSVALSIIIFLNWDSIRNDIGRRYFDGYRHWTVETGVDDNGETTYGETWEADNSNAKWLLPIVHISCDVLVFVFPWATFKLLSHALRLRQAWDTGEILLDGSRVEKLVKP